MRKAWFKVETPQPSGKTYWCDLTFASFPFGFLKPKKMKKKTKKIISIGYFALRVCTFIMIVVWAYKRFSW